MYERKNIKKYDQIVKDFKNITTKFFKIDLDDINHEYEYLVATEIDHSKNDYYPCSYGEEELLNFLGNYYNDDSKIILVDEICSHLSSQNKKTFRNMFLNKTRDKQTIMVTHDIELIKSDSNLIYIYINNKGTQSVVIKEIQQKHHCIRRIIDNKPEILFSSKCFFVEGYTDKIFFDVFLKRHNIYDYIVIDIGGKTFNINKICSILNLDYKILYDTDFATDFLMEETNRNKLNKSNKIINECFNTNDFDKIEKYKLDNRLITYDLIKNMCKTDEVNMKKINKGLNMKKLPKFLSYVFFETLKWLWDTDLLNISYKVNYEINNDLNRALSPKDIDIILKEIENQSTKNTCSYNEFIDKYEELYEKTKIHADSIVPNRKIPEIQKFKSKINNFLRMTTVDLSKIIDEIIDEKIHKVNGKVYIWNSLYNDIEGVMSKLRGKKFSKSEWKYTYSDDIEKYLEEYDKQHSNDIFLNGMLNFFK